MSRKVISASLAMTLLSAAPVYAGDWEAHKFAEIGLYGTDNFRTSVSSDDDQDNEEFVVSIKPSVELAFRGNRFDSDILAEVELYSFQNAEEDIADPRLSINSAGTIVDNLLYVNTSLYVGKLLSDEDFYSLNGKTEANNNESETKSRFKFSPFFSRKIGRFADLYFGYGHQSNDDESDGKVDTYQNTLDFSLARNPKYGGLLWGFGGSFEKDHSEDIVFENSSAYASIGATLGQSVYVEVLGGAETNNFENDLDDTKESALWETNMVWTPSERTSLKVGYGERFFGEGPTFEYKHRVRNSTLKASWTRGLSTVNNIALGSVSSFTDSDGSGQPVAVGDDAVFRTTPFVENRLTLGYKLAGRRSDLVFDAVYSTQEELEGEEEKDELLGRIVFDRHLGPVTTFRIQYDHKIKTTFSGTTDEDFDENRVALKLMYNFDRKERRSLLDDDLDSE